MRNATPKSRIIQVSSDKLHELINAIAKRAYETGYEDAKSKNRSDPGKVAVQEQSIWKIK